MNIGFFLAAALVTAGLFPGNGATQAAAPSYSYPTRFLGACYSPTHYGQSDNSNPQTTLDAFAKDFPLVSRKGFRVVRSYWLSSRAHYLNFVGEAHRNGLKAIIEVPVNPAAGNNAQIISQFDAFLAYVKTTPESKKGQVMSRVTFDNYGYSNVDYVTPSMFRETVILVLAGNENIPADPHQSAPLVSLKNSIQEKLADNGFGSVGVTYCLEADVWAGDPSQYPNRRALLESLSDGVPFLMTCYPFEWGAPIAQSAEGSAHSLQSYVDQITGHYRELVARHPIMIGETGWASEGTADGSSPANLANEAAYLAKVYAWIAKKTNPVAGVLFFEAFDESTKTGPEYERHFGLWTGGTPSRNGDWKQGLPAPPALLSCRAYGLQNNDPGAARGKSPGDTLSLAGLWLPGEIPALDRDGLDLIFEGNIFSLAPGNFFPEDGGYRYEVGGVRFILGPNRVWRFDALSDLEHIDSRDGLALGLETGETVLNCLTEAREDSECLYQAGIHDAEPLETDGVPFGVFQVGRAGISYSWAENLTRISVLFRFRLPAGADFNPNRDTITVAVEDWGREFLPGSGIRRRNLLYYSGNTPGERGFLALDFGRSLGRLELTAPAVWKLFSAHDGVEFSLALGDCRGKIRLDATHRFGFRYPPPAGR